MFGRRRDIQIPKIPVSGDKATQNWMTAVGAMLSKYIGGGSDDRLVSAKELIDGGLAGIGTGGFLTTPAKNLTKPPKVTGLTANGALASIFVQWSNPSFSNYAYTELWRADVNDVGQAVIVYSGSVESYKDNVGSAVTKYYWARAVSSSGVHGDFNAANGVKGQTSLDPDYVMQVLTSSTWKPNTTYYPFQYVRPTVENGFQYAAIDGGKSGNIEPTWPLSVDPTIVTNDGTVQWKCLHIEDRIPFVLGTLEDGTPAVFMDTAYIKDATITSAKISELFADKIETGDLIADLQVKSKLWYGFNQPNGDFIDPLDNSITHGKTGFYFGVNGSNGLPVLHLNTGAAHGNKSLVYDGYDLKLTGDGIFDDIFVDSASFNTISTNTISFTQQVVPSKYIAEQGMTLNHPDYQGYLCATEQINKTQAATGSTYTIFALSESGVLTVAVDRLYTQITCINTQIKTYAVKDKLDFLRLYDHRILVVGSINGFYASSDPYSFFLINISGHHTRPAEMQFYIQSHLSAIHAGSVVNLTQYSDQGRPLTVSFYKSATGDTNEILFYFDDSYGALDYIYSYSEVYVTLDVNYNRLYAGEPSIITSAALTPRLRVQAIKPEYTPATLISSDPLLV